MVNIRKIQVHKPPVPNKGSFHENFQINSLKAGRKNIENGRIILVKKNKFLRITR